MHIDHLNDDAMPFDLRARNRISTSIGRIAPTCGERAGIGGQEDPLTWFEHTVGAVSIDRDNIKFSILRIVLHQYVAIRNTITKTTQYSHEHKEYR